jgi:hypothetical protein
MKGSVGSISIIVDEEMLALISTLMDKYKKLISVLESRVGKSSSIYEFNSKLEEPNVIGNKTFLH